MISNYGYEDASGSYFITIDTSKCDGCGKCMHACKYGVLATTSDDYDRPVAIVNEVHRKKLRYSCSSCKLAKRQASPCVVACEAGAISHSW